MSPEIARAVACLRAGGLVAFPTETVYGLGADARNAQAVAKIFALKGRPAGHPLIVHLAHAAEAARWAAEVPEAARRLAAAFWPGPLTLILRRGAGIPDAVTGGQDTVGLRVPDHPIALELLAAFGSGIAAPSANRHGRISPTSAAHVREELGDSVALVLDGGACRIGIESTIVDLSRGRPVVLRPGAIGAAEIARALGLAALPAPEPSGAAPRAPGSLAAHYAPRTPLVLAASGALPAELAAYLARGLRIAVLSGGGDRIDHPGVIWRRAAPDAAGYARELYAQLRVLDAAALDLILVETPPEGPEWQAVRERLARAAASACGDEAP
ncbi:MAG: L-threonylcarbamoyladenylate synthase [Rhodocyclaceae bacterium]